MKIFSFRKRTKLTDETSKLRGLLERNPGDTEIRVRLADLHVRVGDQESAVKELQTAAKRLRDKGLVLGAIGIYKRILSLEGISLTKEALALLEEADKLLAKVLKIYEEVSQIRPQDEKARAPSEAPHQDNLERIDDVEQVELPDIDDSEPVDIEMLLARSEDQRVSETSPNENPEAHSPEKETSESHRDGGEESAESPSEMDIQDPVHEDRISPQTGSSHGKDRQTGIHDDRETILAHHDTTPSTDDSLPPDGDRGPADQDPVVSQMSALDEAGEVSEAHQRGNLEGRGHLEKAPIPDIDDSEPVDIEMLLAPSEDQGVPEMRLDGNPEEHCPDQETTPSLASPSATKESDYDLTEESAEFLDTLFASLDNDLDEVDIQEPDNADQITAETDSSYRKKPPGGPPQESD